MSLFSIKLKTKNGNDIKKKETFTCYFRIKFKKGLKTTAEYTYRIIHSNGIDDPQRVLELKAAKDVQSIEDLTVKVLLNLCHIISGITKKYNTDPDFILFMSPDLGEKNSAWRFLYDAFRRPKIDETGEKIKFLQNPDIWLTDHEKEFDLHWNEERCKKMRIKKEELDILRQFADKNPNTVFMTIDPNRDKTKYAKSIHTCSMLKDRIDRNLQITEDQVKSKT
jgi:hypothetical protein